MEFTATLTGDATVRKTKSDKQLVAFSVVINDDYKDKSGEKKKVATYINCAYWRSTNIAVHLKKGSVVTVSGRMGINAYKKQDGEFNASLSFTTDSIKIVAFSKKAEVTSGAAAASANNTGSNGEAVDDLPF